MNFEAHARSQAEILLDAIANHVADTARSELDGLRAIVEERAAALQEALSHPDRDGILDRLVQDVSRAAREQAESTAAKARTEVEKRADGELAAARSLAAAQAEAAQAVNTTLLGNIEEAQQQLRTAQAAARAEVDRTRHELEARLEQMQTAHGEAQQQLVTVQAARADTDRARQALEAQIEQMETAHAALAAELADTERDLEAAHAERDAQSASFEQAKNSAQALHQAQQEFEARLEETQAAHAALATELAGTERDLVAARSERDAQAASLAQAKKSVHAGHQERKQLILARDETGKLLEVEMRRASELAGTLETARQEASLAKVEADRRRNDLQLATDRISSLEEELMKPDPDTRARPRLDGGAREQADVILLEDVRTTLQSMYAATTANEILEALIEQLGHHFSRTAVFMMGPAGARGWRAHSFGTTTDISSTAIPRGVSSLLTRAAADRKPVTTSDGDDAPVGLGDGAIGSAVALPILARGQVIAVAYVEDAQSSNASAGPGYKIAEMLIDHVSRRLTTKRTSGQAPAGTAQDVDRLGAGYSLAHHELA
jgi:hypothetical protein